MERSLNWFHKQKSYKAVKFKKYTASTNIIKPFDSYSFEISTEYFLKNNGKLNFLSEISFSGENL